MVCFAWLLASATVAIGEDASSWSRWRGPADVGAVAEGPTLIDGLPDTGLKPHWIRRQIPFARSAGWASPTVADGKVFVFTHRKVKVGDGQPPKAKYPWLPPDKRGGMTDEEYQEYERKRRDEQEEASKFFRYDEIMLCLDAETGKDLWTTEKKSVYTRFAQSGSPTIAAGKLFILGAGRVARCQATADGSTVWEQQLPGEFRDEYMQSSFLVEDNVAVVLASQLFALDASTGAILWTADNTKGSHSSPMLWADGGDKRVVANVGGGETACFDLKSGEELWRVKSDAQHSSPVVVGDKLLTFGSNRKAGLRCYALSSDGAKQLWSFHDVADKGSTPVVLDGHVFVQGERKLACVNLDTGKRAWGATMEMSNPQYTSLVGADHKLMYTYDGLLMFAATPERFELLAQAKIDKDGLLAEESVYRKLAGMDELEKTPEGRKEALQKWQKMFRGNGPLACSSPAVAGGRLYLRLEDGVACYDLKK
ncbi:MAG: PQQ-like beta-propeller repeat protein [Planctomycetales bacterium]|nr:PQQ-like beta-propeller repeat protein [Planctomycetales bacterium]